MMGVSGVVVVLLCGDMLFCLQMSVVVVIVNKVVNGGVLLLLVVVFVMVVVVFGVVEFVMYGCFCDVLVYKLKGEICFVVLMFLGDFGWMFVVLCMVESFVQQGVLVVGLFMFVLFVSLEVDLGDCVFFDGDFENFSCFLQVYEKVLGYYLFIFVGDNEGGVLVYVMIVQVCLNIFVVVMLMEFCFVLEFCKLLCKGEGVYFSCCMSESCIMVKCVKLFENVGVVLLLVMKLFVLWVVL